jgi:superfamily I DNA/RNA helicase
LLDSLLLLVDCRRSPVEGHRRRDDFKDKGLEFDWVILLRVEVGYIPDFRNEGSSQVAARVRIGVEAILRLIAQCRVQLLAESVQLGGPRIVLRCDQRKAISADNQGGRWFVCRTAT